MKVLIVKVALSNDQDLIVARHRTKQISEFTGLSLQDQTRLITAVSELARNAVQYAGGGTLTLGIDQMEGRQYIEAVIADKGPGIPRLNDIMQENYHSRTGLGKGIVGSKRIVDLFSITTSVTDGTTISIGKYVPTSMAPITNSVVSGWTKKIAKQLADTPIQQLQDQNKQLMDTLEELQKYKQDLEKQLENIKELNAQLDAKTQQLALRTLELQEASKHKSAFLANMSHEIRTPLNAMLGINRLLSRTASGDEQKRLLALSREAGKSLLTLINDVLDLSQIEAGKLKVEQRQFDPISTARAAVELLNPQANEKGLQLRIAVDDATPDTLLGDPNRIRQVLINLVGNAIKFSDEGVVEISLSVVEASENGIRLRFAVTDNGPGITAEDVHLLFQSFVQLDSSSTRKHAGSGLGLAISKHIVEVLGGKIGVSSQIGQGSTFWFELPLQSAKCIEQEEPKKHIAASKSAIKRFTKGDSYIALVAEDHPVNQMVMVMELQEMGVTVKVVSNGRQAVEAAASEHFDIIFMDCQMPEMDGYEATACIRSKNQAVPIIALTANAMEGDRQRCLESGMNDYLSKPFESEDLEAVIHRWLPEEGAESAINTELLYKRFKEAQVRHLLEVFLDDLPKSIHRLEDAVIKAEYATVCSISHSLKSACSMVFAERLARTSADIEALCQSKDFAKLTPAVQELMRRAGEAQAEAKTILDAPVVS